MKQVRRDFATASSLTLIGLVCLGGVGFLAGKTMEHQDALDAWAEERDQALARCARAPSCDFHAQEWLWNNDQATPQPRETYSVILLIPLILAIPPLAWFALWRWFDFSYERNKARKARKE